MSVIHKNELKIQQGIKEIEKVVATFKAEKEIEMPVEAVTEAELKELRDDGLDIPSPKKTLWDRVKSVGKNLRDNIKNKTAADWGWVGATVTVGAAAKIGAVTALAAVFGVTAAPVLLTAAVGGAAVGISRSLINNVKTSYTKNHIDFFSKQTLMNTASGAVISAATFGVFSGFEHLSGINLGQKFADYIADIKANINMWMEIPKNIEENKKWYKIMADNRTRMANSDSGLIKYTDEPVIYKPTEVVAKTIPEAPINKLNVAHAMKPTVIVPVEEPVVVEESIIPDIKKEPSVVESSIPPRPIIADEFNTAQNAIATQYAEGQLHTEFMNIYGDAAPNNMSIEDIADAVAPDDDGKAFTEQLKSEAPKLEISRMAGACVVDIPTTPDELMDRGNNTSVRCLTLNDEMQTGDFVTVRDINQANPEKGLKLIFSSATTKIGDFLGKIGIEVVPKLIENKIGLSETRTIAP